MVCIDNNPLTYVLTTPNLDATGNLWVGALASFEFTLEYQKGSDNTTADALSRVPIRQDRDAVWSLLEGAVTGTTERGEALANRILQEEHNHLSEEIQNHALKYAPMHTLRLMPMHVTDWSEAQGSDPLLAICLEWMCTKKDIEPRKRDALLKEWMGDHYDSDEGHALFRAWNTFTIRKGVLYVNVTPKGETDALLAFLVPRAHRRTAINGMHQDVGHQGQQRTLALAEEHFWWPLMSKDCRNWCVGANNVESIKAQ